MLNATYKIHSPERQVTAALEGFNRTDNIGALYDHQDQLAAALNRLPGFEYREYADHSVDSLRKLMASRIEAQAE